MAKKKAKAKVEIPTPRPEILVQLLMDNYGKRAKRRPLRKILLEAGYSEASAKNPKLILQNKTVQEGMVPFLEKLIQKRDKTLEAMTDDKIEKLGAGSLAYILDVLVKNSELLAGRPTERTDSLSVEEKAKLDKLLSAIHE